VLNDKPLAEPKARSFVLEIGAPVELVGLEGDSASLNGSQGIVELVRAGGQIVTVVLNGGRRFNTRGRNLIAVGSDGEAAFPINANLTAPSTAMQFMPAIVNTGVTNSVAMQGKNLVLFDCFIADVFAAGKDIVDQNIAADLVDQNIVVPTMLLLEIGTIVEIFGLEGESSSLNGSRGTVELVRAGGQIVTLALDGGRRFNTRIRNLRNI
jgi:hypothetical protein